jgi:myo-inositol-1(or 4)-monophosphatase
VASREPKEGGEAIQVKPDASLLLDAALDAAGRAALYLKGAEGRLAPEDWTIKGRADFATEVDREAERLIAAALMDRAPGGRVIGEELAPGEVTGGLLWVVDPLDGTTNFLHRYPSWCVSIAALVDGETVAGVVHHVPAGIRYHASKGGGAFQDGRPIRVSAVPEPSRALIGTGFPFKFLDLLPAYQRQFAAVLGGSAGVRRAGSAALDLCDVAAGRFDGFWELMLAPWDYLAGALLVREAGGVVTDLAGNAGLTTHGPIVAGNPFIHAWLLDTLHGDG